MSFTPSRPWTPESDREPEIAVAETEAPVQIIPVLTTAVGNSPEERLVEFHYEGRRIGQVPMPPRAFPQMQLLLSKPVMLLLQMTTAGSALDSVLFACVAVSDVERIMGVSLRAPLEEEAAANGTEPATDLHFLLGLYLRTEAERRFPGDLEEEVQDQLDVILGPQGPEPIADRALRHMGLLS